MIPIDMEIYRKQIKRDETSARKTPCKTLWYTKTVKKHRRCKSGQYSMQQQRQQARRHHTRYKIQDTVQDTTVYKGSTQRQNCRCQYEQ